MRGFLLAFLVACTPPLAFVVAPTFTPDKQAQIAQAAATWNRLTVAEKRITLEGGEWSILEVDPGTGWNGSCTPSRRIIRIHPEPHNATTYAVALHEFGHALGLMHTPRGVMNPEVATTEFSDEDFAECKRVEACSP
jgi:hypothetical protein